MSTKVANLEMEPGILDDKSRKIILGKFIAPFEKKGLQCVGITCNESDDYTIYNLIFEATFIEHHLYKTSITKTLSEFEEQSCFYIDPKNLYITLIRKH